MKMLDQIIQGASVIALGGHIKPDGDCFGAITAVKRYIEKNYKDVVVDCYIEDAPDNLKFLVDDDFYTKKFQSENYDLFIALDVADVGRLGEDNAGIFKKSRRTACIDHHISNKGFADINIIDGTIGSCCEVIYSVMDPGKLDSVIARALFTGIIHDTGVFQYSNTGPETHRIAADLMEYDFEAGEIIEKSFYAKTFKQNRVLGYVLLKAELLEKSNCCFAMISQKEMDELNCSYDDFEGVVSQMRLTSECEMAVLLREAEENVWRVSLRSKKSVDLVPIATYFGGGGHCRAAGCTICADKDETKRRMIEAIDKFVVKPGSGN